ncbi:MAG TPA: hypothetical protein ENO08_00970, partial [Candidatus Eisenbacteria bacterium]|nr:hypothetical protein [Candidatus Eisenbacteria bacterium]
MPFEKLNVEHYMRRQYCCRTLSQSSPAGETMAESRQIEKEIAAQRSVIRVLKREIFGIDKTWRSSYIREFQSGLQGYDRICSKEEVLDRAAASDIVYFGDYHPLEASQTLALDILTELKARGTDVVLALEMLYEYQQETLDRYMKRSISEKEFLDAVSYGSEWGFSWESYGRFFAAAKDPFVPIFGIDYEPRDHLRFIRGRDRMIAGKISTIRKFFPGHTILVVIGESHVAPGHLPEYVRAAAGAGLKETTIVQNADEIYWKLLRRGRQDAEAVRVGAGRYCVFTASPMIKYQSYRCMIDLWTEGEECDIHTPSIVEMVDNILNFIAGGKGRVAVTVGEDWCEPVESVVPEVLCGSTYRSIAARLRAMGMSQRGVLAAEENLRRSGMCYIPAVNSLQVQRFDISCAAREAARFVLFAMRDEIGPERRIRRTMEDRFYAFVFEEALCLLGARIVNPVIPCGGPGLLFEVMNRDGSVTGPLQGMTPAQTREIAALLRQHIAWEGSGAGRPTESIKRIYRYGIRKR